MLPVLNKTTFFKENNYISFYICIFVYLKTHNAKLVPPHSSTVRLNWSTLVDRCWKTLSLPKAFCAGQSMT